MFLDLVLVRTSLFFVFDASGSKNAKYINKTGWFIHYIRTFVVEQC